MENAALVARALNSELAHSRPHRGATHPEQASGTEVDRKRALEISADDYFIKPFSPVALLNKIYALLG